MTPRKVAVVGLVFVAIAAFYLASAALIEPVHVDPAGITMLIALGAAMSLMGYVLFAGQSRS